MSWFLYLILAGFGLFIVGLGWATVIALADEAQAARARAATRERPH